jgi:hypothetical protein
LSTYDYDTCSEHGGWGDDSIIGDGCYSSPVDVDVAVTGFAGLEFYVRFTFTNNDRNMHLNEDALHMQVAACSGDAAAALGAAAAGVGLLDGALRLSSYPQGRIEVFKGGAWGTVCGHWFWDSNEGADIVCKQLADADGNHPYAGGTVYTFGNADDSSSMPIQTGCTVCHNDDTDILTCATTGAPGGDDGPGWGPRSTADCQQSCNHGHDQGAVCFTNDEFVRWGTVGAAVQPCAESSLVLDTGLALFFHCVQFATVACTFDATHGTGSYDDSLAAYTACESQAQPAGYCAASISSAEFLANSHVCEGGSTSNIAFHIRIPFTCHFAGTYHFRMHADYGMGSFIGVDGAEHTPGNLWGHVQVNDIALREGDHEFEALGFEDCCDGHAELEVHFPCDHVDSVWRTVHSGSSDWMSRTCLASSRCPAPNECGPDGSSAGMCGNAGGGVACGAAPAATCDTASLAIAAETALTIGVECADDPDGILLALGTDCAAGMVAAAAVGGHCDSDAHDVDGSIPVGTLARYICPVTCGDCTPGASDGARASVGRAGALSLGGHTQLTEFGLHFDGIDDFATLQTDDYGADTAWTYSLWFSKVRNTPSWPRSWANFSLL